MPFTDWLSSVRAECRQQVVIDSFTRSLRRLDYHGHCRASLYLYQIVSWTGTEAKRSRIIVTSLWCCAACHDNVTTIIKSHKTVAHSLVRCKLQREDIKLHHHDEHENVFCAGMGFVMQKKARNVNLYEEVEYWGRKVNLCWGNLYYYSKFNPYTL